MSLEGLRNRNRNGKLDKLLAAAGKTSAAKKEYDNDQEETYYPERNKSGNGSCIFRFLPGLESEDYPYYIERFQHGFSHNNKWYIEFCPSTIGEDCPACENNFDVIGEYGKWDDCSKDVQDIIRKRGRNAGFRSGNYCNILVIKDPINPENEGKVHLFSFGKGIMDMILDMAQPEDNGLGEIPDPIDVFDIEEGANFKFIIKRKDGRADYSQSCFETSSKCPEFNEEDQQPLLTLSDKKLFKDYDVLSKKLNKVLGIVSQSKDEVESEKKEVASKNKKGLNRSGTDEVDSSVDSSVDTDGAGSAESAEDDNMAYFQGIADDIEI